MDNYTIREISDIIHGVLKKSGNGNDIIDQLLTDSRKVVNASTSLFFALPGIRQNGIRFIDELYKKGVRNFVVNDSIQSDRFPDANFIQVEHVLQALQSLTAYHRSRFNIPVIGITGSNGKTIVKEWLSQLLEKEYQIVRSPKSYNSQIGVPLSVWQMNKLHTLGIFEAGISLPGEMVALQHIIQPTIGVLTHMGDAHSENFTDQLQKIKEKLLLFAKADIIIAHGDDSMVVEAVKEVHLPCLFWGTNGHCDINITEIKKEETHTSIRLEVNKEKFPWLASSANNDVHSPFTFQIPFTDEASVENAITCCCVLLAMGYDKEAVSERMEFLKPVEMRLELKRGINNCSVINDAYISDISSLRIALDFLGQQQQHARRTVILSDFAEVQDPQKLYAEIALALKQKEIHRFIGIGSQLNLYRNTFEEQLPDSSFYSSTEDFVAHFHSMKFRDEIILVKGARIFALEQVSALLEQKAHQTVLEVNLTSIVHNLKQYQQLLQPSTKLMVMVKAFSYGSGSYEIANILQFHKVDYLAVAYADEGVELRKSGISLPIMVMNPEENSYQAITENNLEPEIFSFKLLSSFRDFLKQQGLQDYPVHIKIDTGMHRLGFELHEMELLAEQLMLSPHFSIRSVFSHLAGSESPVLDDFTQYQYSQYVQACSKLQAALAIPFLRHLANSAAIIRHPQMHFDMVRLGIGLYGADNSARGVLELEEAATLKTTIAQIKNVKAGETVGYSRKGKVKADAVIATLRIGYADGYRRILSNAVGSVLVKGHFAPVMGNIAMDMTMIDITGIDGVREGDEVIVFGKELSIHQLAQWAQTIPYEIMTGISQRVPRVYVEE